MKISILADYIKQFPENTQRQKDSFIVMVKPAQDIGGGNEWDGAINMVRNAMQKNYDELHEEFVSSFDVLRDMVTESR